jgi:acyl-CoA ligase (AMP-forming) (exosortase A-associated)
MSFVLQDLIEAAADHRPGSPALFHKDRTVAYADLADQITRVAGGLRKLGLRPDERVAVYLPKQPETVAALFGAAACGGVFVPINPSLKPAQVGYILRDCNVRVLITTASRRDLLRKELAGCPDLRQVVVTDGLETGSESASDPALVTWDELVDTSGPGVRRRIDGDLAAILYTSGSTGRPKGVVLTHRNMVTGAASVASYLENQPDDRLLAVLPLSFDYGLSQLTTAFHSGASVALMEYLFPRDVPKGVIRYQITGLAAVPPLWHQLSRLEWPSEARKTLRYITSSGGPMPPATTFGLQRSLPETRIYLMYGLTEAFRSTYLPPEEVARRPDSIGRPIPNAEIQVVRPDGTECEPHEPGELVHRGALVAQGYWNAPEATGERFRPAPGRPAQLPQAEIAVWSGDQVRRDEEGYLYFVARQDEMIKSSGYRISPTEIEEVAYSHGGVELAVAFGVPHPVLGEAVILALEPGPEGVEAEALKALYREHLPQFMVPASIQVRETLPRNANGKVDRARLAQETRDLYQEDSHAHG